MHFCHCSYFSWPVWRHHFSAAVGHCSWSPCSWCCHSSTTRSAWHCSSSSPPTTTSLSSSGLHVCSRGHSSGPDWHSALPVSFFLNFRTSSSNRGGRVKKPPPQYQSRLTQKYTLIPKTIGNRKRDCAWGCAGVKKLKKNQLLSTNHQNPYLLRLVMICAQQLIFLQFFNTCASSRTISFSISNSFWY